MPCCDLTDHLPVKFFRKRRQDVVCAQTGLDVPDWDAGVEGRGSSARDASGRLIKIELKLWSKEECKRLNLNCERLKMMKLEIVSRD